jgi:hypothetical protein
VATLATALYAPADDILTEHPDLAPWRPPAGMTSRLNDAELATLATMQAIPGFTGAEQRRTGLSPQRHLPARYAAFESGSMAGDGVRDGHSQVCVVCSVRR